MIISRISAGLCNQIYFFSTAYALSREWNEELALDICIDGCYEWVYLLDEFNLPKYSKIIYPTRYYAGANYHKMPPYLQEKVAVIDEKFFEEDGEYLTIPKEKYREQYGDKDIYLKGTFLARQMFTKYLPELRSIFTLREPSDFVNAFEKTMDHCIPIGVHIRRQGFSVLGDDNSMDFFKAAIVHMRQLYAKARFYIFSDELDYAKEHLGAAEDIFYVDAMNGFRGDIEEFICLTKCHHYILTRRSTYGRMAEILNDHEDKVSVLYGQNTWNDSEERFHFLSDADIEQLSPLYKYKKIRYDFDIAEFQKKESVPKWGMLIDLGLNSENISPENRKILLYNKAQLYMESGCFKQAVHLCNLLEDQYGEDTLEFHRFYGDALCACGRVREALVEYICAAKKSGVSEGLLQNAQYAAYNNLPSTAKHYIITQCGNYSSQYLSELHLIGLILGRMGNKVSFILKRTMSHTDENDQDNIVMKNWEEHIDQKFFELLLNNGFSVGRFYYGYPCYDWNDVVNDSADQILKIAQTYPDKETVIVGRDPQIMSLNCNFKKVFVDFSSPFDEAHLKEQMGQDRINAMYENADIIITMDEKQECNNKQIIKLSPDLIERTQYSADRTVLYSDLTLYTEDYLDIALKIALAIS